MAWRTRLSLSLAFVQLKARTNLSLPSAADTVYVLASNDLASVAFTGESTSTSPLFSALTAALSSVRKRITTFWVAGLCAVPQYFGLALSTILLAESKDSTVYGPEPTASVFALYLAFLSNTRPGRPVRYHSRLESGVERVSLTVLASTASALSRLATWLAL